MVRHFRRCIHEARLARRTLRVGNPGSFQSAFSISSLHELHEKTFHEEYALYTVILNEKPKSHEIYYKLIFKLSQLVASFCSRLSDETRNDEGCISSFNCSCRSITASPEFCRSLLDFFNMADLQLTHRAVTWAYDFQSLLVTATVTFFIIVRP